jgi:hypothetical protein
MPPHERERERRFYDMAAGASSGNARYAEGYKEYTSDDYETESDSERTSYGRYGVPPLPRRRQNQQPSFDEREKSYYSLCDTVERLSTLFSQPHLQALGAQLVLSTLRSGSTLYSTGPNSQVLEKIDPGVGDDASSSRQGEGGLHYAPPSDGRGTSDDATLADEDVCPEMDPEPEPEWERMVPKYNGGCMYYPSDSYSTDQLKMMLEGRVKLRNGLIPIADPDGEGCDCELRWVTNDNLRRLTNRQRICDVSGESLPLLLWCRASVTFYRE